MVVLTPYVDSINRMQANLRAPGGVCIMTSEYLTVRDAFADVLAQLRDQVLQRD